MRDKNRSLIPTIVVAIGVLLTIALSGFIAGTISDMIDMTAKLQTGHVKVCTRAYAENSEQMPNDLCIIDAEQQRKDLQEMFPNYNWENRIMFGGLIDHRTKDDSTIGQGSASVMAIDMSPDGKELERLNIKDAIVEGVMPKSQNEVLLGVEFADKLGVEIGDTLHFMGSTMNSSMSFALYKAVGTITFGNEFMDRSMVIMDLNDARDVMDMTDASSFILGFHKDEVYFDDQAIEMSEKFNELYAESDDEFAPTMLALRDQNGMSAMIDQINGSSAMFVFLFVIVMSIVLWNTGLVAGLRRYNEFGIRLALGESKGLIYRSLIWEALLTGIVGSIVGTVIAVSLVYYFQVNGIDISGLMPENTGLMIPSVFRTKFSWELLYIGFIPGVVATVLGALLSGKGIYKRQTSQLMKEMEI